MHSSDKYLGIMSLHHFSRVPVPVRSPSFSHARLPNPARQMLLVRSNGTLLIVLGGGRLGSSVVLLLWWCVCVRACSFFFICARGTLLLLLLLWLGRKMQKRSSMAVRPPSGDRFWQPLINCQNGRSGGCSHNNLCSSLKSCPIGLKICVLESHLNSEGDKNMIQTKLPIFVVSRIYLWYLACMWLELAWHE